MSYEKLVSVDGIEFTTLRGLEQTNIETEQEQIDIEAQNTTEDKSTTCYIYLEEMIKNKLLKSIIVNLMKFFISCFMLLIAFSILVNSYYTLPSIIFFPSVLNYCDNIYYKCKYYKVHGKLINNTMMVDVKNFIPQYNLISTYEYGENGKNEKCINIDYHKYTSFEDIQIVKEKTINIEKDIFVSYLDKSKCKDNYEYYNPLIFYAKFFGIINLISIGVFLLFVKLHNYLIENNYNIIYKNFSLIFIFVFGINCVITTFISSYYNILLLYNLWNIK